MNTKSARRPITAICDGLLLLHGIFADEAAYRDKNSGVRVSPDLGVLNMLTSASFIFDELTLLPLLPLGLQPVLGVSFLELFGNTILKLQRSGFVAFDLDQRIPENKRHKFTKVSEFIKKVNNTTKVINRMAYGSYRETEFGFHQNLVYSRFAELPLLTTIEPVSSPIVGQMNGQDVVRRRIEVLHQIFAVELPNFAISTLDEILEIRQAKGAREFRDFFQGFYVAIEDEMQYPFSDSARAKISDNWCRLRNEGMDLLVNEFQNEITGWQVITAGVSIALDMLGFIPGVSLVTGAISTGKDTKELVELIAKQRRAKEFGWLCFLSNLRRKMPRV